MVPTSATHVESQVCEQQYESVLQICVTHASHPLVSLVPVEQYACEHVFVPVPVPEQVLWPQMLATSPIQMLFQLVVQQYESWLQI